MNVKHISVEQFKAVIANEKGNRSIDFVNVCTPAEYKERHIEGVRNVPLDELANRASEFADKKTVYVHCRSGNRAQQGIEKLQSLGIESELINVDGGLLAWDEAGLPTKSLTKRLPIMRQVLLIAGLFVVIGVVSGYFVHSYFLALPLFVGAGLSFAGSTGWCGMSFLLAKMPWNK